MMITKIFVMAIMFMITNNIITMIKNMTMMTRSKPVCEVEEEGEKREVCSFTYKQVFDIDIIGLFVINLIIITYTQVLIFIIIEVIVVNLVIIIFMTNFDIITKGSHTVAAVAVEMMLDLR